MHTTYEKHHYLDPDFPIFFHLDELKKSSPWLHTHWHEHIELLYIKSGNCTVCGNGIQVKATVGDVILITSNCIHDIKADDEVCQYYCITADKSFCDNLRIPTCSGQFAMNIQDKQTAACFKNIVEVMEAKPKYFQEEAKVLILQLIIRCCREAEKQETAGDNIPPCSRMVTNAIDYLRAHFNEPVTVAELCSYLGFSKYYVCRKFKAQTGRTVTDYLNYLRCANARRLIASGKYNISESAAQSGYNNMSYFSKTYRAQMGCSPSEDIKRVKQNHSSHPEL